MILREILANGNASWNGELFHHVLIGWFELGRGEKDEAAQGAVKVQKGCLPEFEKLRHVLGVMAFDWG